MGQGCQLVEVDTANIIPGDQDTVAGMHLPDDFIRHPGICIDIRQFVHPPVSKHLDEFLEDMGGRLGVVHSPMVMARINLQGLGQGV